VDRQVHGRLARRPSSDVEQDGRSAGQFRPFGWRRSYGAEVYRDAAAARQHQVGRAHVDRALDARRSADGVAAPDVRRATVPATVLAAPEGRHFRTLRPGQVGRAARDAAANGADLRSQTAGEDHAARRENGQAAAAEATETTAATDERRR